MKIPITVNEEDKVRLKPHLTNYAKLNELLLLDVLTEEDILIMLSMESRRGNGHRPTVVQKLIGRYTSLSRRRLYTELNELEV